MTTVVIPTYNRSFKLRRVLDFYASYDQPPRVVVLDGSDDPGHKATNEQQALRHSAFVERRYMPEQQDLVSRLLTYLDTIDDSIVAIGNDEDAFFPDFLEMAFDFLGSNPDYVAACGQYVTFGRSVFGLRRIMFWTDTFVGMSLDANSASQRVVNFQRMNSGGVPPLFWSIRRKSAFIESMRLGSRLKYASGQEFMDQIYHCASGKILLSEQPMLLRDESRQGYVPEATRDTGRHYMFEGDLDEIERVAAELWADDVVVVVHALTSWYRPNEHDESLQSRLQSRSYSRFHANSLEASDRPLRFLGRLLRQIAKVGAAGSQMLAYFYYLRYMRMQGKGEEFKRLARTVATNQ